MKKIILVIISIVVVNLSFSQIPNGLSPFSNEYFKTGNTGGLERVQMSSDGIWYGLFIFNYNVENRSTTSTKDFHIYPTFFSHSTGLPFPQVTPFFTDNFENFPPTGGAIKGHRAYGTSGQMRIWMPADMESGTTLVFNQSLYRFHIGVSYKVKDLIIWSPQLHRYTVLFNNTTEFKNQVIANKF